MNPGSPEAISKGCTCPVLDNSHGKGYMGIEGVFVYNGNCPVHDPERIAEFKAQLDEVWPDE